MQIQSYTEQIPVQKAYIWHLKQQKAEIILTYFRNFPNEGHIIPRDSYFGQRVSRVNQDIENAENALACMQEASYLITRQEILRRRMLKAEKWTYRNISRFHPFKSF